MPHRAGYFVFAHQWDHHCHNLVESIKGKFQYMVSNLDELKHQDASDTESLIHYYKKWHYNKALYDNTIDDISRKQHVIDSLGYRGYGVNRDLHGALETTKNEYTVQVYWMLEELFHKHINLVKKKIYLPQELIDSMNCYSILTKLCKKLDWNREENIPHPVLPVELNLGHYFHIMSKETPWPVNTAIFQKLFLKLGSSSMTIMKGSTGYHSALPPQDLKIIGNRNFIEMYKETFSNLHIFTDIGTDLLKRIHLTLSKDLDPNAGNFRTHDFPDKNGVTLDFGNFERELGDLAYVLSDTGESFHHLDSFIYNLSRSYYMFIGIHPFWDSNGRVGKCFLNHVLIKKGSPPISFKDGDEIFALPRYGGAMEDMHEYIKKRITIAVDSYFYERWKLEHFGFLDKQIYNVSFDSGFHFSQIDDRPYQKLEVNFQAYLIDDNNPLSGQYQDQCGVVFPHEYSLRNMTIYCGFSRNQRGDWEHAFDLMNNFFIKEIESDHPGIRAFDIDFTVELHDVHYHYDYFNCCVVSHEDGRIFNNKGLNYSYKIEY